MTVQGKIAPDACGCDDLGAARLMSMEDALSSIQCEVRPIQRLETVPLACAVGRVLAQPIRALGMTPPFDNSAMDGFALNTQDLQGKGPWTLSVQERVAAGQMPIAPLQPGHVAQVFTGAPIPAGADAVVMQEAVRCSGAEVMISRKPTTGTHLRRAGEDMKPGQIIVPSGRYLSPRDIAACAGAGHSELSVTGQLRIALVVTGDEVQRAGASRDGAQIWDINTPMLSAAMARADLDLCEICTAADTRSDLQAQLAHLSNRVDLIVTTGGVSVGEEDHVKPALLDAGGRIHFSGVAIKPGKPISFGHINGALWLGLPGNPLSALLTWHVFGQALCDALSGVTVPKAAPRRVTLSRPLTHKPGRCELRLAKLRPDNTVDFADKTQSGQVSNLPQMDGVLVIPAQAQDLPKGAQIAFQPF